MALNKPSGNMYPWAWTWNPIGGLCEYACSYCYVRNKIAPWLKRMGIKKYSGFSHLIEKELKTKLKKTDDGRVIFVASNADLFGGFQDETTIIKVLKHCQKYPKNTYLFQTKNPDRLLDFATFFPKKSILGTTLETNREDSYKTLAPSVSNRYLDFIHMQSHFGNRFRYMISIEPIIDFDLKLFVRWMREIGPNWVSIGADSQNCGLPEPSPEKVEKLIKELEKFTEVRIKDNLKRLMEEK